MIFGYVCAVLEESEQNTKPVVTPKALGSLCDNWFVVI